MTGSAPLTSLSQPVPCLVTFSRSARSKASSRRAARAWSSANLGVRASLRSSLSSRLNVGRSCAVNGSVAVAVRLAQRDCRKPPSGGSAAARQAKTIAGRMCAGLSWGWPSVAKLT